MTDWVQKQMDRIRQEQAEEDQKGGPGSGHFGHAGRPGKRGGSQPGKGGGGASMSTVDPRSSGGPMPEREIPGMLDVADGQRGWPEEAAGWKNTRGGRGIYKVDESGRIAVIQRGMGSMGRVHKERADTPWYVWTGFDRKMPDTFLDPVDRYSPDLTSALRQAEGFLLGNSRY